MIKRRRKILLFSILFICLVVSLAVFTSGIETAYAYSGGLGTSASPYEIRTVTDLNQMRNETASSSGKFFKQMQDINLSGQQWTPIGTSSAPFRGNYDGGGFSINNLTITTNRLDSGFFGYVGSAQNDTTIKDITFENVNINFTSSKNSIHYAGVVAAYVTGRVTIEGVCVESGTIDMAAGAATGRFGGIVGHADSSTLTLTKSYNKAAVTTNFGYAGGIIGSIVGSVANPSDVKISVCFNEGAVTAASSDQSKNSAAGGILGGVESGNGQITIEDCYNLGAIHSSFNSPKAVVGGIIGKNDMAASGNNWVKIKTSFNASPVTNISNVNMNGLVGGGTVSIEKSFQYNSSFTDPYKSETDMKNQVGWLGDGWKYNNGAFPIQEYFWSIIITIEFNYNYPLSPAAASITKKVGETITQSDIPKPSRPTSEGTADFIQWETGDGSIWYKYNSSGNISILVTEDLRGVTLYAKWDVKGLVTVTFNYNYPTTSLPNYTYPASPASMGASAVEGDNINIAKPNDVTSTDVKFVFLGWAESASGAVVWEYDGETLVDGGNYPIEATTALNGKIMYARWDVTRYVNITFNNAFAPYSSVTVKVEETQTAITESDITNAGGIAVGDLSMPTRFGATFDNWNTSINGGGTSYTYSGVNLLIPVNTALNRVTLYAQWNLTKYTLAVDNTANLGTASAAFNSNPAQVTVENAGTTALNITATGDNINGYAFYRWRIWNVTDSDWEELLIQDNPLKIADLFNQHFIFNQEFLDDYFDGTSIKFQALFYDIHTNQLYTLVIKSDQQSFGFVQLSSGRKLEYNKIYRFLDNETVNIEAVINPSEPYYVFKEYSIIKGDCIFGENLDVPENNIMLNENTVIVVVFEKESYTVVTPISYVFLDGTSGSETINASVSGTFVKIGDEIQIACVTNKPGYRFIRLNAVLNGGDYVNVVSFGARFIDNSGVCYLKISKELLDSCLVSGELKFVVVYAEQFEFKTNFENHYYESVEIYATDSANEELQTYRQELRIGATYYLDKGTIVIVNIVYDKFGYPDTERTITGYDVLFDGVDYVTLTAELSAEDKEIFVSLKAQSYDVFVAAKWFEGAKPSSPDDGNKIKDVSFSKDKLTLNYNDWLDSITKTDVSGYKFLSWKVWDWTADKWVDLGHTNINTNNLIAIQYSFFKDNGYIDADEGIRIIAEFIPVYTLTLVTTGSGTYKVKINDEQVNDFSFGQFENGTKVEITVTKSDYIDFSGFNLTNINKTVDKTDYVLSFTFNKATMEKLAGELNHSATVSFEFKPIVTTLNIKEQLNDANGTMEFSTSGTLTGNNVGLKLGDVLTFTFEAGSTHVLDQWTVNGLTVSEMVTKGYAVYSGNVLMINVNEETLDWLTSKGDIDVVIKTVFNPLYTTGIIAGGILVPALLIFILVFTIAAAKKKRKIKAAREAGIIGSARFKTNIVEDALRDTKKD